MKKLIAIYALASSSMAFLAQSVEKPRGEASVVFESAGGKWQKVLITDQSNGESSVAYSLDAEPSVADTATERHPRIAFYCQKSGEFDRFRIRTGTAIANQATSASAYSLGWAQLSTRSDDQQIKTRTADIARNGSDFLMDKGMIFDLMAHKKLVVRFASASGYTITDEYLTVGLLVKALKTDCPALFKDR
jgi:hypothetical protein